jgi:hypothetical protein
LTIKAAYASQFRVVLPKKKSFFSFVARSQHMLIAYYWWRYSVDIVDYGKLLPMISKGILCALITSVYFVHAKSEMTVGAPAVVRCKCGQKNGPSPY